jgi:cytosine/adenosine deaminase-related metal-dependent hydrolase
MIINNQHIKKINTDPSLSNEENDLSFYFENALVFPGLINSHDHLDFNLFPRLGNRIYKNYLEWGNDIHQQNKTIINAVLKIPKTLRTQWGIYKNLLNGITTVFNHGKPLHIQDPLIDIFQDKHSLHSVRLEKNWKWKLNDPFNKKEPYVIHVGEGTDEESHKEIDTLIRWNKLHKKLIGIHGVAMDTKQATAFKALAWCPDSNLFLLGTTAAINELKRKTTIVFGTDSTVSADWNIWNQLRVAKKTGLLSNEEIFASLTTSPANLRGLHNIGILKENSNADVVVAEKKSGKPIDVFFELNPEDILMIMKTGNIILFDESLLSQFVDQKINTTEFCRICMNGRFKYVKGDPKNLIKQVRSYAKDIFIPIETA